MSYDSLMVFTGTANPKLAQEMGDRARDVARTSYSQDMVGEKLEEFYFRSIEKSN